MTQILTVPFEIKSIKDREIEGYGSIFGNVDLGGDVVLPGAFKASLAQHRKAGTLPIMMWMHAPSQVPGVWTEMAEDEKGLRVKGELVDTQLGNEVRVLLQKKAVRGLSIGYRTLDSDFDRDGNRLLKQVDLWETSIVSLAMNPLARVEAVKARLSDLGEYVPTEREFERGLRDAGYSRNVARHITAKVYDAEMRSETLRDPGRWDAGKVENDDEAAELLKAINGLTDKIGSAALSR